MAIVINGSGTVTGLAVGGLPDGTVDAGTLATNSVDSAELVDGSIDTAHIGTDQITSAILPAGSVLQVVQGSTTTEVTNSSNTYTDTSLTATITPSSTSSTILVMVVHTACNKINNTMIGFKLLRGSTVVFDCSTSELYTGTTLNLRGSVPIIYKDSPATTSATTYKTTFNSSLNTSNVTVQQNNAPSTITLMEIAG